tara:strand:- start:440 stop:1045 length:606 start_codon:yes stop_codon:yes gene_type:complete
MTIISLDAFQREKDKLDLKESQRKEMDLKRVKNTGADYQSVQDASNDKFMKDALTKVRKSKTSVDVNLSRYNGTYLYTESQKNSELEKELQDLENEVMDDLEKEFPSKKDKLKALRKDAIDKLEEDFPTHLEGKKPRKRRARKIDDAPRIIKEEVTWNYICEQLEKPRWKPSTTTLFGGIRNTSPTYERELFPLEFEGEYE